MAQTSANTVPKLAIIDDILAISPPHFAHIPSSKVEITVFRDTLPPYDHPSATQSDKDALEARLKPFTIISTMRERTAIPPDLLRKLPNLKLLLVTGMRHNWLDQSVAKELGITVAAAIGRGRSDSTAKKAPDLSNGAAHATTQHTWALILGLARGVAREDYSMKNGGWQEDVAIGTLGRILGVVGMGRLGAEVARIGALGFGMRVICWSANLTQEKADEIAQKLGLPVEISGEKTFKVVSKEDLFRDSDIVTLHYTLSERSRNLVDSAELGLMKKSALLVNTSRGPIVRETALLEALEKGQIKGAALDTFDIEPLPKSHPFRSHKWGTEGCGELLVSPHMGYVERETLDAFYAETAENLERCLDGRELLHRMV
jgi:lactate dehydrogenase-like 2-hydroxyacid dehydrogenase